LNIRHSTTKKGGETIHIRPCPPDLRKAIFGQTHKLGDIAIKRMATTPLWRAGELYAVPGYDRATRTWVDSPSVPLPPECGRAAAEQALVHLRSWLREFDFVSAQDEAVALTALISAAMRASVRPPAFIIQKHAHGAGASTLAELIHVALTGRRAAVINGSNPVEELDKEINSAQAGGRPALVVDNIPPSDRGFNSIALAQVITQQEREYRILGKTQSNRVENSQLVILNGKNVRLRDDMSRRCLTIELDPQMEQPEFRTFERPTLIEDAIKERVSILAACYTIVTAYYHADEYAEVQVIAGFEDWCDMVSAALKWLGLPDVAGNLAKTRTDDPVANALRVLLESWRVLFGDEKLVTCADLVARADPLLEKLDATDEEKNAHIGLRRALDELATDSRGHVTAKKLASTLGFNKGLVVGDYQLTAGKVRDNTTRWQLVKLGKKAEAKPASAEKPAPADVKPPAESAEHLNGRGEEIPENEFDSSDDEDAVASEPPVADDTSLWDDGANGKVELYEVASSRLRDHGLEETERGIYRGPLTAAQLAYLAREGETTRPVAEAA
jgi:hypothetical protein